jgi:DNA-binding transcriptional ArsR family regulator
VPKAATSERRRLETQQLMKAMSHPLRAAALRVLNDRTASPAELSRELGADLSEVSYHVRRLVALERIELVRTTPVRGALEHFYRATSRHLVDSEDWEGLDPLMKEDLVGEFMQKILDDFVASTRAGILGADKDFWLTRTPLVLDAAGLQEALKIHQRAFELLQEVESRSTARLVRSRTSGIPVSSGQGLFKMPVATEPDPHPDEGSGRPEEKRRPPSAEKKS